MTAKTRLMKLLPSLSGQKRKAATYMSSHLREVTMLSLRKVAERALVSPTTLVNLSKDLGYESYVKFKTAVQEEEAGVLDYFSASAEYLQSAEAISPFDSISATIAAADMKNIAETLHKNNTSIERIAEILTKARRIYVVGMRATHGLAYYLYYLLRLVRDDVVFVHDGSATAPDMLSGIGKDDVLVVYGFYPYIRTSVALVNQGASAGAKIVAVTDSLNAPIVHKRGCSLIFHTSSPWILGSITAANCATQAIVAQFVRMGGATTLDNLRDREKLLAAHRVFTS